MGVMRDRNKKTKRRMTHKAIVSIYFKPYVFNALVYLL